jgi:hypothetical protein
MFTVPPGLNRAKGARFRHTPSSGRLGYVPIVIGTLSPPATLTL